MATPPRRPRPAPPALQSQEPAARKKAGRPPGPPTTVVNIRIRRELLARLDRYIDRLESRTGEKTNRAMIATWALERWLDECAPE